jgi:hypothetical protein
MQFFHNYSSAFFTFEADSRLSDEGWFFVVSEVCKSRGRHIGLQNTPKFSYSLVLINKWNNPTNLPGYFLNDR